MAISALKIYSNRMWEKYNTPISKAIAEYSVGVISMAMPIFSFLLALITILILHADIIVCLSVMIPLVAYTLYHMFIHKINSRFDEVLEKENEDKIVDAQMISDKIKRTTNLSTVVTVISSIVWVVIIFVIL